jgi:excisionase family DNA binding protein
VTASVRTIEPAVLTSWKEVASYLGKGVRTVQRWEKQDGLPIRRIAGTSKIIVNRHELDRWLQAQPVGNGGSQPSKLSTPHLQSNLADAKQLRERHHELRMALHGAMEKLHDECQRMMTYCADPAAPPEKKNSPN